MIDTHCHLADPAFDADREDVLARAWAVGVTHAVSVGESPEQAGAVLELARRYPDRLSATAGLHPHEARRWSPELAAWLDQAVGDPAVVAVGETGLDYHYDNSPRERQREAFEAQLDLAVRRGKPAVIHSREADPDMASALRHHPEAVAVLHSFSGGAELLETALALGHYVSWSGMITFKSWKLDDLIRRAPLDRQLVETDAPYLAPVPHRGRRCEPAYVVEVAARLAVVLECDVEDIARLTTANAVRLFGPRLSADTLAPRPSPLAPRD